LKAFLFWPRLRRGKGDGNLAQNTHFSIPNSNGYDFSETNTVLHSPLQDKAPMGAPLMCDGAAVKRFGLHRFVEPVALVN
jgi:hypothetical protein